jgi:hypothetical protein
MADINSGKEWSAMDLADLHSGLVGYSLEELAHFLCRDVQEVQAKMGELGFADRVRATSPGLP